MELDFVAWLRERLPGAPDGAIGVGDDAALLPLRRTDLVVTTDLLIDRVHFDLRKHEPERVGRKALAVNLSDLAAMAARPAGAVVSLALPRGEGVAELAKRLVEGMLPLAERFGSPIVGGDTNTTDGPLAISVAAFGTPGDGDPLRRDGARPGDRLLVTGRLGGSLLGGHLDFTPRIDEAITLNERFDLHAGMDLSDGLALDLARLTAACGAGAVIDEEAVPISDSARERAKQSSRPALVHALTDGEDFELLLAAAPEEAERIVKESGLACGVAVIGEMVEQRGVELRDATGATRAMASGGYEHR